MILLKNLYLQLGLMLVLLAFMANSDNMKNSLQKTIQVQYKRDIKLYCGDGQEDDDNDDDNDNDGIKDADDDDDDNDGTKDEHDDDDDNDGIKDDDEKFENLWKDVQFFRASPVSPNDSTSGVPTYELIKPDGQLYRFNSKRNILTIHYPKRREIESSFSCNSSNPSKTIHYQFNLMPFLYVSDYQSYSHFEGAEQTLGCKALFGFESGSVLKWKWKFGDKVLESSENATIESNTAEHTSSLILKNLSQKDEGTYTCIASNDFGSHQRSTILRIKEKYGFLWPMLGALVVLIVVVIIVLISELIQKAKEKKQRSD